MARKVNAFFKSVKHPGTKKQPFLAPGLIVGRKVLDVFVKRSLSGINIRSLTQTKLVGLLDKAVRTAAFAAQQSAQRNAPVRRGRLKSSVNVRKRAPMFYTIGTNVVYARWVEEGTRPHTIRVKTKKALAFFWAKLPPRSKRKGKGQGRKIRRGI